MDSPQIDKGRNEKKRFYWLLAILFFLSFLLWQLIYPLYRSGLDALLRYPALPSS
jgi:hypothetical protein